MGSEVLSNFSKLDVLSMLSQARTTLDANERLSYVVFKTLETASEPVISEEKQKGETLAVKKDKSTDEDYVDTLSDAYLEKLKSKLPNKIVLIAKKKGKSLVIRKFYGEAPNQEDSVQSTSIHGSADASEFMKTEGACCKGCLCGCRGFLTGGAVLTGKVNERKDIPPGFNEKKWETLFIKRLRDYVNRQISHMDGLNQASMEARLYNETGWLPRKDENKNSILNNPNLHDLYVASKKPLINFEEELKRAQKEKEEFLKMVEKEVQKVKEYLICCMSEKSAAIVDRMIEFEEAKYKDRLKCSVENMANESKRAIKNSKLNARTAVGEEQSRRFKNAKTEIANTFNQRLIEFNRFITDKFNFETQQRIIDKDKYFRIKVQKLSEKCNQLNHQLMNDDPVFQTGKDEKTEDQVNLMEQLGEVYDAAVGMFSDFRNNKQLELANTLHEKDKEINELTLYTTELEKMNENWKLVVERLINQFQKLINFVTKERPIQNKYLLSLDRLFKLHLEDFIKVGRKNLATRVRKREEQLRLKTIKRESSTESQHSSKMTRSSYQDSCKRFESNSRLLTAVEITRQRRARLTSKLKENDKYKDKTTDDSSGDGVELENLLKQAIQVVESRGRPEKTEMTSQNSLMECTSTGVAEERLVELLKSIEDKPQAKKLFLNY